MDKKIRICITSTTISDMTRAYMAVCRQRKDDIRYHEKENLKFELDGCLIKFMFPGHKEVDKYTFDQIIIAGDVIDNENSQWIKNSLIPRLSDDNLLLEKDMIIRLKNNNPFWNKPQFPYKNYDGEL